MEDLLLTAKAIAAVLSHGETYEKAAQRIMSYDSVPYPVPAVFMSSTVAAFLRALAMAEAVGTPATGPSSPLPSYGPALRESS